MGNTMGNGMTILSAKIVLGVAQGILLLMTIGIGSMLLNQRVALAELQSDVRTIQIDIDNLEIPPQWFIDQVERMETKLDSHMRTTGGD